MIRTSFLVIGLAVYTVFGVAGAQDRATPYESKKIKIGDPAIEQCLSKKLGQENACASHRISLEREACVSDIWLACHPPAQMNISKPPITILKDRRPCLPKDVEGNTVNERAPNTAQIVLRMKDSGTVTPQNQMPTTSNPPNCTTVDPQDIPDAVAAAPQTQKACSQCTGSCQTVSWFSGHSSYNDVDVGGGQSPSQCIDAIEQYCEAGASRFMASATCKN